MKKAAKATKKSAPAKASAPKAPVKVVPVKAKPASAPKAVAKKLTPEEEVAQRALIVTDEAKALATTIGKLNVDDVQTERSVVLFRNEVIKVGMSQARELLDPIVKASKEAYDTARGQRDKALEPFEKADRLVLDALSGYYTRQKQRQREEQERADREQSQREAQAAAQRAEENRTAIEQLENQLSSLPTEAPRELYEKIEAQIRELEGTPVTVPIAPPVRVSAPETTGAMTQQDNWKGEVIEKHEMEVLKQIVAGELPMNLIKWNEPEFNRLAKLYTDTKQFPGIRFWNEPFVRGVGRR